MKASQKILLCSMPAILALLFTSACQPKVKSNRRIISFACTDSSTDAGILATKKALVRYQKMHPEIKIETKFIAGREYQNMILNMIASGNPPDIFRMAPDSMPVFLKKGVLLPLDDFITNSKTFKLDDFFENTLWKYKYDGQVIGKGKIYGFGTDWSPDCALFFNEDLFNRSGLAIPKKSLSWQEYVSIAQKITSKNGQLKCFGSIPLSFTTLLLQAGGKMYTEDGKKCLLNSLPAIEALSFLYDGFKKYKIYPSQADLQDSSMAELFMTERLGIYFAGRYNASTLQNTVGSKFKWGVAPTLHKDGRERVNECTGPYGWVISSKTRYPEDTWKLYEYMVCGDGEKMLAAVGYNIPILKSLAYSRIFQDNPSHPKGINKVFLDEIPFTVPSAININADESRIRKVIADEILNLKLDKLTPEKVADNITKSINVLLAEGL